MQIVERSIETISNYENNPRNNDGAVESVVQSIKEFGFKVPIIIDGEGTIVAGHTRIKAAKKIGLSTVPCIIADDLTPEQIKAFRLADNKTAELAEWDFDLLEKELKELSDIDFEMTAFGFDDLTFEISDFEEEEEALPDISEEEPVCKIGDLWKLGNHLLICGDGTDEKTIAKLMNGESADLLLTDPPYNVDYTGKTEKEQKIINDNMSNTEFKEFLNSAFSSANTAMKSGASFYIWHADSEGENFRSACRENNLSVRQCLIWNKNSLVLGRQDYQWKHEPCLYGWKEGAAHKWRGDRRQTTVIDFEKPVKNDQHPTMKPIGLFSYLIENSTDKGDIVLDTFSGSGTTIISCERRGRKCRAVELDPKYCDVIIKRFEAETGENAQLVNTI